MAEKFYSHLVIEEISPASWRLFREDSDQNSETRFKFLEGKGVISFGQIFLTGFTHLETRCHVRCGFTQHTWRTTHLLC